MNESKERQNDLSCTESLCDLARIRPCASQALEHNSSGTELQVHTSSLVESRSRFDRVLIFREPSTSATISRATQAGASVPPHCLQCWTNTLVLLRLHAEVPYHLWTSTVVFRKEKLRHKYLPRVSFVTNTVLHTRRLCSHGRLFHVLPPTYERDRTTR